MKILVVITRMHATHGSENDEFVENWDQSSKKEHKIFDGEDRKILLLHGYKGKDGWNPSDPDTAVPNIISEIHDLLRNDLKGAQLGLLFHPRSGDKEFSNALKNAFRQNLKSAESVAFTELHAQGQIDGSTNIARLAQAIKDGKDWQEAFGAVWGEYGIDKVLEKKLEILHSCLTPEGANQFLRVEKWEELPEEIREMDDVRKDVEQLKNYEKDDYLESKSDYVAKLTDLRDQLLGAP